MFCQHFMHKIYKDFHEGKNTLVDGIDFIDKDLFEKYKHLWCLLSRLHFFSPRKKTNDDEKEEAAKYAEDFTSHFPVYFPKNSITRKMHIIGFVIPDLIRRDTSDNICLKYLKLEQAGERVHNIWNTLTRSHFFSVKDSKQKLFYTFLEYENLLYVDKNKFNR